MSTHTANHTLAKEIMEGLRSEPKYIRSMYFYDDEGDKLFQSIMNMPEYYLTDCEFEIFDQQAEDILKAIAPNQKPFNLIELGAGDGSKTEVLLRRFLDAGAEFTYCPIDISPGILAQLEEKMSASLPELTIHTMAGDYFELMKGQVAQFEGRNVYLFLGSTLGNYSPERAREFLHQLRKNMRPDDQLLMGVDLKKNPQTILDAYNDPHGITREFNFNLLRRLNRELGANFNPVQWMHYPTYSPETGEARSYLVSRKEQSVHFEALDETVHFKAWEEVHTEISKKYHQEELNELARETGFKPVHSFLDCKHYFVDVLWHPE